MRTWWHHAMWCKMANWDQLRPVTPPKWPTAAVFAHHWLVRPATSFSAHFCFGQAARPACPRPRNAMPRIKVERMRESLNSIGNHFLMVDTGTESSHIITTRSGIGPLLVRYCWYHRRGPPVGPDAPATNSHSPVISAYSPVDQHGNGTPKNLLPRSVPHEP